MRVLLDECTPRKLRRELPGHEVKTISEMGWAGLTNGLLLARMAGQFDALLTVDQNIEHQQRLPVPGLAIIILCASSNDIDPLRPLIAEVRDVLSIVKPGELLRVPSGRSL